MLIFISYLWIKFKHSIDLYILEDKVKFIIFHYRLLIAIHTRMIKLQTRYLNLLNNQKSKML
jgi:hypothetical protein